MISIIICSRTTTLAPELTANIDQTIGLPYELVLIDNSANKYSICQAYNLGVAKSKYPILCFMHDDISYHTHKWGSAVIKHFESKIAAAIGIVGTPYVSFMPGPYWGSGSFYENILQSVNEGEMPAVKSNLGGEPKEVIAFDGVWFCIKKEAFDKIKFDELNFKGFHFYDMDIGMQLYQNGFKIYCIDNISIHHQSMGSVNNSWIENALIFQKKWRKKLPSICIPLNYTTLCKLEYKTLNTLLWACFGNGWPNKKTYHLALKYLFAFKKGYLFYKTPGYFTKFLFKMFFKKGAPFYSL